MTPLIEHKTALEVQRQWVTKDNEAFARLSENEDGRAFLCRLIAECGVFERNLESDAARMAFNEGRRSVGLWVLELLETAKPGSSGALLSLFGNAGSFLGGMIKEQNEKRMEMEAVVYGRNETGGERRRGDAGGSAAVGDDSATR